MGESETRLRNEDYLRLHDACVRDGDAAGRRGGRSR